MYTPGKYRDQVKLRTRAYAVAAGQSVTDSWELQGFEQSVYHLLVCGPNGFLREFAGTAEDPQVQIRCEYRREKSGYTGDIELRIANHGDRATTLHIKDHGYTTGDQTALVSPGSSRSFVFALAKSHHWYDFSATIAGANRFLRRFAGRVETGKSSFSDPVMGRVSL